MVRAADKLLTFEEFAALNSDGRYELVHGRLVDRPNGSPRHGWAVGRLIGVLGEYLRTLDARGLPFGSLDIPTAPLCGRCCDVAYYAPADAARIDFDGNRVL